MLVDINNMKYQKDLVDCDFSSILQLENLNIVMTCTSCHDENEMFHSMNFISVKKHQKTQLSQEPLSPLLKFQNFITFRCFHRGAIFCFPFFFGFPGVYLQELLRAAELGALGISSMKPQVGGEASQGAVFAVGKPLGNPQNHQGSCS